MTTHLKGVHGRTTMTDQNRINGQCPRCQSPLLYNADKDIFYCECGYTEKVKHNINIITNNNTIYQQSSKSSAENDDEYIYNSIFNKAITYLKQDDEDSFYELENVLRKRFPFSYLYSIYTAFIKEGIPHIIVNPFDVDLSFVDDELDKYISPDKDGLLSDEIYADLAIIGYSLFEENKIVLNEEQRSYLYDKNGNKFNTLLQSRIDDLSKIVINIKKFESTKPYSKIKYDIDMKNYKKLMEIKKHCIYLINKMNTILSKETDFIKSNINKVSEFNDQRKECLLNSINSKESTECRKSGFVPYIIGLIIAIIGLAAYSYPFFTILFFGLNENDSFLWMIALILVVAPILSLPFSAIGDKREYNYIRKTTWIPPLVGLIPGITLISLLIIIVTSIMNIKAAKTIRKEMGQKQIDFEIGRSLIFDEWNNNKPNEEFEDLFSLIVDFEL